MAQTRLGFTGGQQQFTVPDQVTSITVELVGAKGGGSKAGKPGRVIATFIVTPGQIIYGYVGGQGSYASQTLNANGGWNGGGKAYKQASGTKASSGGGCTDIRIGGTSLASRKLVAAGSGGVGGDGHGGSEANFDGNAGGDGGGNTGEIGDSVETPDGGGGHGGTQVAGGTKGAVGGPNASDNATAGALGIGGDGANGPTSSPHGGQGGGAGGGYYGGGGGGQGAEEILGGDQQCYGGGGGGGGSNLVSATINGFAPTGITNTQGYINSTSSDGYIIFTYDIKPTVQAVSPAPSLSVSTNLVTQQFTSLFTDDMGQVPASYQLIIEDNSTGIVQYDSGQTAASGSIYSISGDTDTGHSYELFPSVNPSTYLTDNTQYRWKMRAWDTGGHVSDYTAYTVFKFADPPSFTISPVNGAVLANGRPIVSWNDLALSMDGIWATYSVRFIRVADSAVVHDSGINIPEDGVTSYTPSNNILPNGDSFTIEVTVSDSNGLTTVHTVVVTTSYTVPNSIYYSVDDSVVDVLGYVDIDWSSATADPGWNSWKVYRKLSTDSDWSLLVEITEISIHNYHDWLVKSQQDYQYTVTQTTVVSDTVVESIPGYFGGGAPDTNVYFITLSQYWIIDTINEDVSVMIPNVTSAPMGEEYEEAEYTLIGRGRKKDYGTRLGYTGTLTAQLRGTDGSPALIRSKLEMIKKIQDTYWLRTPFGDLFMIGLGQLDFSALAGVSTVAMYDVSIPFEELAGEIVEETTEVTFVGNYQYEFAELVDNGDGTSTLILSDVPIDDSDEDLDLALAVAL